MSSRDPHSPRPPRVVPREGDTPSGLATPAGRLVQIAFFAVAVGITIAYAGVVRDGEDRRSPDALARRLQPDYTGSNRLAPDFELADRNGRRTRLSSFRGKTVVLHFWTRTCPPCIEEIQNSLPAFEEIIEGRSDLALVMVTVDPNWASIAPIVPNTLHTPILFDPDRAVVSGKYGTRLFPETWVIDPRGVIRARFDHVLDWESPILSSYLDSLRH